MWGTEATLCFLGDEKLFPGKLFWKAGCYLRWELICCWS